MQTDEKMNGSSVFSKYGADLSHKGRAKDAEYESGLRKDARRLQDSEKVTFDLSNYMTFEVVRGGEDSAPLDKLSFEAYAGDI